MSLVPLLLLLTGGIQNGEPCGELPPNIVYGSNMLTIPIPSKNLPHQTPFHKRLSLTQLVPCFVLFLSFIPSLYLQTQSLKITYGPSNYTVGYIPTTVDYIRS